MGKTSIEWCDYTFNAWVGCTKVSPACDHCYAEGWAKRSGMVQWGPHGERRRTTPANWKQPYKWNIAAARLNERKRVFCLSLGDWLDNQVPPEWREELCQMIEETAAGLDWLLLTKRIQNYAKLAPPEWVIRGAPENVWLGITCCNQEEFDRDFPILARHPAVVKFISYEPALGPLQYISTHDDKELPNWIICGGESGPKARDMDPEWARYLRDACKENGVSFFLKQMSRRAKIPDDLMVREFPRG